MAVKRSVKRPRRSSLIRLAVARKLIGGLVVCGVASRPAGPGCPRRCRCGGGCARRGRQGHGIGHADRACGGAVEGLDAEPHFAGREAVERGGARAGVDVDGPVAGRDAVAGDRRRARGRFPLDRGAAGAVGAGAHDARREGCRWDGRAAVAEARRGAVGAQVGVAGVALEVVVAVGLRRVGDERAVVALVEDAVAVGVGPRAVDGSASQASASRSPSASAPVVHAVVVVTRRP